MAPPAFGRLSVKAYARLRAARGLVGGSDAAVKKAMQRLGFERGIDGLIDADELHRAWAEERGDAAPLEPAGGGRTGRPAGGEPSGAGPSPAVDGVNQPAAKPQSERAAAITRKELALARLRELEVDEKEGALIPLDVHEERVQAIGERVAAVIKNLHQYDGEIQRAETEQDAVALVDRIIDEVLSALLEEADALEREAEDDELDGDA